MPASPLFKPTPRLVGYCVVVGLFGAAAALGFDAAVRFVQHHLLETLSGFRAPEPLSPGFLLPAGLGRLWIPVITTLGGLASGLLVYRFAPEAEGHGTDAAIAAYQQQAGEVRHRVPLVKGIASALTIGSGGVAGREGPSAQITVGLGSLFSHLLGLRGQERRALMLAAMAAGLAAIFRAPLGMAIFSVEVIYSDMAFEAEALIYTVIAAVSAYAAYGFIAGWSVLFSIPAGLTFDQPLSLLTFAGLGVAAGVTGAVLPTVLYGARDLFRRLPGPPHVRPAIGGLIVGLVGMAVPEVLGSGYGWVELAILGRLSLATTLIILLLKGPGMAMTIGSGGSGGVFAPTVTTGAMLGAATGMLAGYLPWPHPPLAAFVVVGMAAVFAGAARTPISTLIMVAEMTGGYGLIVPAMLANILSFLVQRALTRGRRYPTLYQSQVPTREDSPLHRGVFVRRALDLIDKGHLDPAEVRLPRLISLLRYGEPIRIADGTEMLAAIAIEPGSPLAGQTVAEGIGGVAGATAVAVLRGQEMLVPRGATRLEAGDQLLLVAVPEAYEELLGAAGGDRGASASDPPTPA